MEGRRSRSLKKQSTASNIFARLVMPVSVIMAIALFYFSVKLFFFSPPREKSQQLPNIPSTPTMSEPYEYAEMTPESIEANTDDVPSDAEPVEIFEEPEVEEPASEPIKAPAPEPEPKPEPVKAPEPRRQPATRPATAKSTTATKTASAQKPATTRSPQSAQGNGTRWDVQIGGFRARAGAEQTVKDAGTKGYTAYIVDETLDGRPFYKVRVRGYADVNQAQSLSKKLEAAGFPVYVVSVK